MDEKMIKVIAMQKDIKKTVINKAGISAQYANAGIYAGSWKFGLSSGKLSVCPRMRKMLEISKESVISLVSIFNLLHPGQAKRLIREFRYACLNGVEFEMQLKITTPAQRTKWLKITGMPYFRRWGTAEQMIGVIEDVTQRVEEECLSLAVVNHELRNPLTIIKLNTQLLINMFTLGTDKHSLRLLTNVDMHINCMAGLIEEYMTPSWDDKRSPCLNCTVFDVDELLDIVINEMRTVHPAHRFCKNSSDRVWVRADKYKIIQVLFNYFTNAVNFSPAASKISISATQSGGAVEIAISDQGIGIPEEQEQHIFQKFYSCSQRAVRHKNSKGLGLYLVKKIIEEHGGRVKAERGIDGGSVFYFSLPVYSEYEQPVKITG